MDNKADYHQQKTGHEAQKTPLELLSTHLRGGYYPVTGFVHSASFSTEAKENILLHLYSPYGPV